MEDKSGCPLRVCTIYLVQVLQDRSTKGDGSGTARESIHESLSLHLHNFFRGSHKPPKRAGAFVLPQMLRIIFKLMVSCNDSMLRLEILKDTLGLLEANPLNSEALTLVSFLDPFL